MQVELVDVIPAILSDETRQDSEASIAVNPRDPRQLALSAFTVNPEHTGQAPIFVSTDAGRSWALNVCLPGGDKCDDITVRFGAATGRLYAAVLRRDDARMEILRADAFPPAGPMTSLFSRAGADQPWVESVVRRDADGLPHDRVMVTANLTTAVLYTSDHAERATAPDGFATVSRLDRRHPRDRPTVRVAPHRDGTSYLAFLAVDGDRCDLVVLRDRAGEAAPWTSLVDPDDQQVGRRVAMHLRTPGLGATLGSVRVSSRLAMAVDPGDSDRVYLAWCDGLATGRSPFTLRLRRSDDGGLTWSRQLRRIPNVTNPALAVNVHGTVGLLYQQLKPSAGGRWDTHLELSEDGGRTVGTDLLVAALPDRGGTFQPTIGDYASLLAVGKDFHGAFCGYNRPDPERFPHGVNYQRQVDWADHRLLSPDRSAGRAASIDPFYLRCSPVSDAAELWLTRFPGDQGLEPPPDPLLWTGLGGRPAAYDRTARTAIQAEVRRRAEGPPIDATIRFLAGPFGIGMPLDDPPGLTETTRVVRLPAKVRSSGASVRSRSWRHDPAGSAHQRTAVEVSSVDDPLHGLSWRGRAPGWPDARPDLALDNNRALTAVMIIPVPTAHAGTVTAYAVVRNAADVTRDLELIIRRGSDDAAEPAVTASGLRRRAGAGRVTLRGIAPAELRWIGITAAVPATLGALSTVDVYEMLGGLPVDGIRVGMVGVDLDSVTDYAVRRLDQVLGRVVAAGLVEPLENGSPVSGPDPTALRARWPEITALLVRAVGQSDRPYGLNLAGVLARNRRAIDRSDPEAWAAIVTTIEAADLAITLRTARA